MLNIPLSIFRRVSVKEKALFTRAFSAMIAAGLPLVKTLVVLSKQTSNELFVGVIEDIIARLEEGEKLSSAIARYPQIFDRVYVSSIKAAEVSGKFEVVLENLAKQQEGDYKLNSVVKASLAYPLFIVGAMVVAATILMIMVVPKLQEVFTESKLQLPFSTRALIWTTGAIINYWYIVLALIIIFVLWIRYYLKTENGKAFYGRAVIALPVVKGLFVNVYMARFTRTLGMLLQAGVPIVEAVSLVGQVTNNLIYERLLTSTAQQLERGVPMSTPLSRAKEFPAIVSQMIAVGEQTGKMDEIMVSLSSYFEEETSKSVGMLTSLLEPVMLIIVGAGVGVIVFSIIVPIYQISTSMQ